MLSAVIDLDPAMVQQKYGTVDPHQVAAKINEKATASAREFEAEGYDDEPGITVSRARAQVIPLLT